MKSINNMLSRISILVLIIVFLASCKEKPVIIPDFIPPESDRVVLIEELTGVKCVNCPSGAAKVQELLQLFEGQLVAIAIHGDVLSEPLDDSKYDFRNQDAADIEHMFEIFGKPAASINREKDGGDYLTYLIPDTWSGAIEDELLREHKLNIELETEFDRDSRELKINIGVVPLTDLEGDYYINVGITESHIIDAQINSSGTVLDYEHNHVLKDMITGATGELFVSNMSKNVIVNKAYHYTLPTDDGLWVPENCHIVVFVSRHLDDGYEILQAAEAEVVH